MDGLRFNEPVDFQGFWPELDGWRGCLRTRVQPGGSLVPTPGGAAGAFHVATAGGLILLGVLENDAKSIAIVLHLIVFGSALPLGVLTLLRGGYSLSRLRAALSEDLNSIHDFSNPVDFEAPIAPIVPADGAKVDP